MKYTFQTDSAAEGLRIDACIRRFLPELPSRAAQEAFSHRDVKLDGKRVKPDVRVHAGQCVEVFCMEQTAPLLDVVYEDADVLLVNKRAGISVEADEKGGVTLTELAARHVRQHRGEVGSGAAALFPFAHLPSTTVPLPYPVFYRTSLRSLVTFHGNDALQKSTRM